MGILIFIKLALLAFAFVISSTFLLFSILNLFLAAPFVPSSRKTTRKMLEAVELTATDTVYDLGSGDGRLVISAARRGVKDAVGFELNPFLNLFARLKAVIFRLNNTTFLTRSLWKADLSKCDKLFIYLLPEAMERLETKILKEMKPGSYLISNAFSFKNIEPERVTGKVKVYKISNKID